MSETWTPPPRDLFSPHEQEPTEASKAARYLIEVLQSLKNVRRVNAQMGSEMGKAFIRVYETGADRFTPEHYKTIQRYVMEAVGPEQGRIYISGFLSELAAASIFTDLDLPTYYPLKEEDLYHGVDWWVDLSDFDSGAVPIQVKAIPLREGVKNKVIYPIQNEAALQELLDTLILPENLDTPPSRQYEVASQLREKITASGRKLMGTQQTYSGVIPAFMLLQSPNSEGAQFNTLTGKPNRAVLDTVFAQLEEFPRIH